MLVGAQQISRAGGGQAAAGESASLAGRAAITPVAPSHAAA